MFRSMRQFTAIRVTTPISCASWDPWRNARVRPAPRKAADLSRTAGFQPALTFAGDPPGSPVYFDPKYDATKANDPTRSHGGRGELSARANGGLLPNMSQL